MATHGPDRRTWESNEGRLVNLDLLHSADLTKFLDDHPGGPEIVLDKAGEDAHTEFEDIGHSLDARDMLKPLLKAALKEDPEAVAKAKEAAAKAAEAGGGSGMVIVAILVVLAAIAYTQFA